MFSRSRAAAAIYLDRDIMMVVMPAIAAIILRFTHRQMVGVALNTMEAKMVLVDCGPWVAGDW
jgi:hypothetical protein